MQWLLSDGVGNTSGAVDSAGNIVLQHFDAFGVPIDRIAMATTNPPTTQAACSARNCELCNGLNDPGSRGRAATGPLGYHGQEGYATNCDDPDRLAPLDTADPGYEGYDSTWSAGYEDRSTGLIHIGARDYEPETGRFLQADPIQIDPLPVTWGHLNRWTYCANEPVNAYDLAGFEFSLGGLGAGMAIGATLGALTFGAISGWDPEYMILGALIGAGLGAGAYYIFGGEVGLITVSHWGPYSPWVQKGCVNYITFFLSGVWTRYPYGSGLSLQVPAELLQWPSGPWGYVTGFLGHRIIN